MNLKRGIVALLALWTATTFGTTATEKAALQSQINAAQAQAGATKAAVDAVKATVDALPVDAPPVAAWPRTKLDVLDIDFVGPDSFLKAKLQDGSGGYDQLGHAIHYGDMAGVLPGPDGTWNDMSYKFSNPSCQPIWATDAVAGNLHYLRSCTDGSKQVSVCDVCRLTFWNFRAFAPAREYFMRYMLRVDPITLINQTELGIKLAGMGSEQLELGPALPTGWELQLYSTNAERGNGYGLVQKFGVFLVPARWYVLEEHVKANSVVNGVYKADGVVEVKLDGKMVWTRSNVLMFASTFPPIAFDAAGQPLIAGAIWQAFHGGLNKPANRVPNMPSLIVDQARIAICKSTWCGPAPELGQ